MPKTYDFAPSMTEVPRDRWGRPLIRPADGGKPVGYVRVSSLAKRLEDQFRLAQWKQRQVAKGIASNQAYFIPSILQAGEDKDALNAIVDEAREAVSNKEDSKGTHIHALTEIYDRGDPLPENISDSDMRDLQAYIAERHRRNLVPVSIEEFGVIDEVQAAGTWDRIYRYTGPGPDGRTPYDGLLIGDVKTGSLDWSQMAFAMQMAMYSRATPYAWTAPAGQERGMPWNVDQDWAVVLHLPQGEGRCEMKWVDIRTAWEYVLIARKVKDSDKVAKHIIRPAIALPEQSSPSLEDRISSATSYEALRALHAAHRTDWTPRHTDLAKTRRKELEGV